MTGFPTMGGSGLIATRLGIELANLGHDIHFLFYKKPFFLKDFDKFDNITFHLVDQPSYALFKDIGAPYTIQAAAKISQIVRDFGVEIMHSHYAIPHSVASYLAKQMSGLKTVVTTHGSDTHTLGKDISYNETIQLALRETDAVTSVSKFLARETESVFSLPTHSVQTVYDFINISEFYPKDEKRKLNIIHASNFRPVKQVPYMIQIFAELVKEFPNWTLDLVGNGPDWPVCQREARKFKIQNNVNFLGVRKDVPSLLSSASILASTSKIESFGLTIAEAMASETPVWASNVGGVPEVCQNNVTGLLYDIESKDDAIEKLAKLMADEELRSRFGKNGRRQVTDKFSTVKIVKQYEEIYNSVLSIEKQTTEQFTN
ncbi:MAG: N-acetyl-alpha-D-glucosaminyl L-malate synthase BshA [Candidatus Heimdallarchaeota archaeon]|nr:N-acetyl-alpha-D-glucosaminyl L-malate synthase BshA [Candidatus Heimdallarchaeota archaeon]